MNKLYFILLIVLFLSCKNENNNKKVEVFNTKLLSQHEVNKLTDETLLEGNVDSYSKVHNYYSLSGIGNQFLYTSMVMAHKYNYPEAFLDTYYILAKTRDGKGLSDQDNRTINLALYYLLKSKELGCDRAKFAIEEYFGKDSIPPQSNFFLKQFSGT